MVLVAALVFLLTIAIVVGIYWAAIVRPEDAEARALRERLKTGDLPAVLRPVVKERERLSSVGPLEQLLSRSTDVTGSLNGLIQRSGRSINPGTVVLACVFLALIGFLVASRFSGLLWPGLLLGAALGWLPILALKRAAAKRIEQFEDLFPEAIDLMARSLRAGHALTSALQMVADEIPEPVATEFKLLFDRQNYGMSLPDALREFGARVPLVDARFFVTAILTQRETGGNLSEVLDNLASVIRERFKVKRQVRVMSAHGRITGWVLGFLPPAMAVILFILSPDLIRLLVEDPMGRQMLGIAAALQVVGIFAIRKIVDVEY